MAKITAIFSLASFLLLTVSSALAGPAPLGPVVLHQPDGTKISARILGDERFLVVETLEGYTIARHDKTGEWRFAVRGSDGRLSASPYVAGKSSPEQLGLSKHIRPSADVIERQIASRRKHETKPVARGKTGTAPTASPGASPGGPQAAPPPMQPLIVANILVILADFPPGFHCGNIASRQDFEDRAFSQGSFPSGSAREFFLESSYYQFSLNGSVTNWISVPNPYEYYCCAAAGMGSFPYNSQGLVKDLCQQLDATVDFSQFDADNDGYVDGVVVIFEGEANGTASRFWPHAWELENESIVLDGKTINRYCLSNEQTMAGLVENIGVFCHELGHVFGAPDLYDYTPNTSDYQDDSDNNDFPVAHWCLMARGGNAGPTIGSKPSHPCSLMKSHFFGWMVPTEITSSGTYTLPAFQTAPAGQRAYRIPLTTDEDEYLLIANRGWNLTLFDHYTWNNNLRNSGLVVIHVDWHSDAGGFANGALINDGPPSYSHYAVWVEDHAHPSPVTSWPYELKLDAALSVEGGCTSLGTSGTAWASAAANHGSATPARISNVSARGASMTFDLEYVWLGTQMPQGDIGYYYDYPLPVSGNAAAVTCTITSGSLPTGLEIDCGACVIFGTPLGPAGNSAITVRAEANGLVQYANMTITIADPVQISSLTIPANWAMGDPGFSGSINTLGGAKPLLFELENTDELPPGLVLENSSGIISGTPSALGDYNPVFIVTDSAGAQDSDTCTITIGPPSVIVPPVTGLGWSRNGTTVTLAWDESPAAAFFAYVIYREEYSFNDVTYLAPIAQVTPKSTTQYDDVPPGDYEYYYAVAVLDNVGYINPTVIPAGPVDVYPPMEVTNLSALIGESDITLSWTPSASPDAAGYRIAWDTGSGFTAPLDIGLSNTINVAGLDDMLTYTFRITVYDEVPNESAGAILAASPEDITAPADVAYVTAESDFTLITLEWPHSTDSDVQGYIVEWGREGGLSNSEDVGNALTFTADNLNIGTFYVFRVRAYDDASNYSKGYIVTAATPIPPKKKKRHCGLGAVESDPNSIAGSLLPVLTCLALILLMRGRRFLLDRCRLHA
ncbi:MAG: M6 family metalloprotease domain-containing protein [Planctomycetota bacterium]|jgi:M6 family metalloprotease-like protein